MAETRAVFYTPTFSVADQETRELCELWGEAINLLPATPIKSDKILILLASFLSVVMKLKAKNRNLVVWPHDDAHWSQYPAVGKDIVNRFREALIEAGWLTLWAGAEFREKATVYRIREDLLSYEGKLFEPYAPLVIIKNEKDKFRSADGAAKSMGTREAKRIFGKRYEKDEARMERLREVWIEHPLTLESGSSFCSATRIYNDGKMDRGGRLYGGWQTEKEIHRVKSTIDGEAVAEIDLRACNLVLLSGLTGTPMPSRKFEDPYRLLPCVLEAPEKRGLVKEISIKLIGSGNPIKRRSTELMEMLKLEEYKAIRDELHHQFPALLRMNEEGLEGIGLAYHESEIVIATIEGLKCQGVVAYPMHDAILVKAVHADQAAFELRQQFSNYVRQVSGMPLLPSVTIQGSDGVEAAVPGWC